MNSFMKADLNNFTCSLCGKKTRPKVIDIGIGMYEYWGARAFHSKLIVVSECCGERLEEDPDPYDIKTDLKWDNL